MKLDFRNLYSLGAWFVLSTERARETLSVVAASPLARLVNITEIWWPADRRLVGFGPDQLRESFYSIADLPDVVAEGYYYDVLFAIGEERFMLALYPDSAVWAHWFAQGNPEIESVPLVRAIAKAADRIVLGYDLDGLGIDAEDDMRRMLADRGMWPMLARWPGIVGRFENEGWVGFCFGEGDDFEYRQLIIYRDIFIGLPECASGNCKSG